MEITECEEKGFIRKVSPNFGIIKSLKEVAQIKHEEVLSQNLTKRNISVYFTIYYDAIRELLEAYCLSQGFKVLNHVCLGEKMKQLNPNFDYTTFDRIRFLRNGINYYGKQVPFEQGSYLLNKMQEIYHWILGELNY